MTQHYQIGHITSLSRIEEDRYVRMDKFTVRSLELVGSMNDGGTSLLDVIDHTISPMGARLLKRWLLFPLKDVKPVNERLDVVEYFFREPDFKDFIAEKLHLIGDLERIVSKAAVGRISPREVVQLKVALQAIAPIKNACMNADNESLRRIGEHDAELIPMISSASICWVTRMVPISEAMFEPTFPARISKLVLQKLSNIPFDLLSIFFTSDYADNKIICVTYILNTLIGFIHWQSWR